MPVLSPPGDWRRAYNRFMELPDDVREEVSACYRELTDTPANLQRMNHELMLEALSLVIIPPENISGLDAAAIEYDAAMLELEVMEGLG